MELKGTLSEGALPGLLRELYVGRRTGVLHLVRGRERHGVRFRGGHIVSVDPTAAGTAFAAFLGRRRLVPADVLERAAAQAARDKKSLAACLIDAQAIDREGVATALELHVREVLLEVFSWPEGSYTFEAQPDSGPPEDLTPRLSTGEMILEAVRRVQDPDVVRYALGDIDRVLTLSTDPLLRFQKITLSPTDGYVLSRVDGTLSAREVVSLIPQPAEETQRSLFGLLSTGIVEYLPGPPKPAPRPAPRPAAAAPPPPGDPLPGTASAAGGASAPSDPASARRREIAQLHEGLKDKNHFEVLGIPRASNESQVKEAFFRLAKEFHPDRHRDPGLADLKDTLEAVFIRLGEAYEVLRNPKARAAYESDLSSRRPRAPAAEAARPPDPGYEERVAEESVRCAEGYYEEGKYWDAIQLAEPAVSVVGPRFRQRARLVLARSYFKNPNWTRQAEAAAQQVVDEDPRNADGYLLLGQIYKAGGLKARALSMYRKVAELRPDHEEARAELAVLAPEPAETPPAGGILKKFLRKG